MASYLDVIFWALVGGLFSLIGGVLILVSKTIASKVVNYVLPFAAGALLAASFFELLPEAVGINDPRVVFMWVIIAIVVFFLLEQYLNWFHHHHEHDDGGRQKSTAPLMILGDAMHNVIDGVVIGAAFLINVPVGIVTTIAVAAHEVPQEIGNFGVLLKLGMSRKKVLFWNVLISLTTLAAALITFSIGEDNGLPLGAILGLSAGLLIYIAMSDLIPAIHEESKGKLLKLPALLLILGIVTVGWATNIAHQYIDEGDDHGHIESVESSKNEVIDHHKYEGHHEE